MVLTAAILGNFSAPVSTLAKYYTQGDKVLFRWAFQVNHPVFEGFQFGKSFNKLKRYGVKWKAGGKLLLQGSNAAPINN
uniref:Uncharacterized protein n=1 Tax=uncultured gamma proteobacterium EF100_93H11 TaxID=710976 RepID=E0Y1U0_9GAMM|nr:hypothetical protein [uncultured gamma proteobacterium EF100_93H11]